MLFIYRKLFISIATDLRLITAELFFIYDSECEHAHKLVQLIAHEVPLQLKNPYKDSKVGLLVFMSGHKFVVRKGNWLEPSYLSWIAYIYTCLVAKVSSHHVCLFYSPMYWVFFTNLNALRKEEFGVKLKEIGRWPPERFLLANWTNANKTNAINQLSAITTLTAVCQSVVVSVFVRQPMRYISHLTKVAFHLVAFEFFLLQ